MQNQIITIFLLFFNCLTAFWVPTILNARNNFTACKLAEFCTQEESKLQPLCGSNGRIYNSLCEIKRSVCSGNPVSVHVEGPCPDNKRCILERNHQLDNASNKSFVFIPECEETSGYYITTQCHKESGYCWCVTKLGRPLPLTSVKNKLPDCSQEKRSKVERRSHRIHREERLNPDCESIHLSAFTLNLLRIFKEEYLRDISQQMNIQSKHVIEWKFSELDRNTDGRLTRRELRFIKQSLVTKECLRKFIQFCDLDRDKAISFVEWMMCLEIELLHDNQATIIIGDDRIDLNETMAARAPQRIRDVSEEEIEKLDCHTQRTKTMEQLQNNPQNGNYIPTCTGKNDILYDKIQCHRLSHFCWCVDPETGAPISGTSKYRSQPDCNSNVTTSMQMNNREIKGCLGRRKVKFFRRLFSSLVSDWILSVGDELNDANANRNKAVRWKFELLDANNNSYLERKEWKQFRNEIKQFNKLRKCGRNFIRFCDADSNKRISLEEWLNCTINVNNTFSEAHNKLKFYGKNPFLDILRPDD